MVMYGGAEDRLNPETPEGADEATLGGYVAVHGRAAALSGGDGEPYTVAIETEHSPDADPPWAAYLVFIRWAHTGTAIMGHLETDDLVRGGSEAEVRAELEALPLDRVKQVLDEEIRRRASTPP